MPFGILLVLWMLLVGNCQADVHFTMRRWEVELGKPLVVTWADANGAVNVTLVKATARGPDEVTEIVENYTEDTFTWTPVYDLHLDKFILRIYDAGSIDESPSLLLPSHLLQDNVRRDISDSHDESGISNDGLPPGAAAGISVGSTLGGVFLLALVAFLIYRRRQNRTKLEHQEAGGQNAGKQTQKEPHVNMPRAF
ncbi:hypothetical protein F4818DRAFT_302865 [Hypoxylon cercidicola]|nr:hypothetical protein F4818DRAFT_302865 [Hypoxylon cercidicola]